MPGVATPADQVPLKLDFEPIVVANAIIAWFQGVQENVTPMKLQKLAYYAHSGGLNFLRHGVRDGFEAWPYGPVNREIYFAFRHYGSKEITELVDTTFGMQTPTFGNDELDRNMLAITHNVCRLFAGVGGGGLVDLTHRPDSAWNRTVDTFRQANPEDPKPYDRVAINPADCVDEFRRLFG